MPLAKLHKTLWNTKMNAHFFFFRSCLVLTVSLAFFACKPEWPQNVQPSSANAPIFPHYEDWTEIPCNIAPLNFALPDSVKTAYVELSSSVGKTLFKTDDEVVFSQKIWKHHTAAAQQGRRDTLQIKIALRGKNSKKYTDFLPLHWVVCPEPIDPYLVYRFLPSMEGAHSTDNSGYNVMELRERRLENFDEKVLLSNTLMARNCFNCHVSSASGHSDKAMIHLRKPSEGSLFFDGKDVMKVIPPLAEKVLAHLPDSLQMPLHLGYPAWHPNGKWIAFSTHIIGLSGYAPQHQFVDIFDTASNILLYNTQTHEIVLNKALWTTNHEETWPAWSPDGKWLYFCSAAALPPDTVKRYPEWGERIKHIRFDLCRIAFEAQSGVFSDTIERILSSGKNRSFSMPSANPDGKSLLLCRADFNSIPYHANGDLVWLDLENLDTVDVGRKNAADILNSEDCESWHDWSENGRWVVFGSKRQNGHYQWLYIAYFDGKRFGKPFLLPQKKARFYENCFRVFNMPDFSTRASQIDPQKGRDGKNSPAREIGLRENLSR